jgi:hypothetical protein
MVPLPAYPVSSPALTETASAEIASDATHWIMSWLLRTRIGKLIRTTAFVW